ncbi:MAG: 23S rRNA (adenine(2030)-N(6))-methyltransferase RlmJ [Proteobacteria bacterium]|nr:23S rRNA (adenine(2030)-N(6))-methyltransferase RlmJ [Pseudomonadota bacterium]
MLSYRHSYHAGNFADVLKHTVQTLIIQALKQKPKPFVYYDTHAGAGRYDLTTEIGQKIAEYKEGIEKIWQQDDIPELLTPYINIIKALNTNKQLNYYPGSPLIADSLMHKNNRLELSELHPADFTWLKQEFKDAKNINIKQIDGYKHLISKLPPIQRRALILIDPPYELKTEYGDVIKNIKRAHTKFATGIYAIWYPVVSRQQVEKLCQQFKTSGIKNILRIELCITPEIEEYGMTGTGMIIINPPWKLEQQMHSILPWLLSHLKQNGSGDIKIEALVPEA